MNYYQILGVPSNASFKEIKSAFRQLSKKYHPDVNGGNQEFTNRFILIQEAYEVLGNENSRAAYDFKEENVLKVEESNSPPEIMEFSIDKKTIANKEEFTVRWNVKNVNFIRIRPLGVFPSIGEETFIFNTFYENEINIILEAQNSFSHKQVKENIVLTNKIQKQWYTFGTGVGIDAFITIVRLLFTIFIMILIIWQTILGVKRVYEIEKLERELKEQRLREQ